MPQPYAHLNFGPPKGLQGIGWKGSTELLVFLFGSLALSGIHAVNDAGIPIVMAAGNEEQDARTEWAGSISEPIVVGAALPPQITDPANPTQPGTDQWQRASYSNHGPRVDCWASGVVWTSRFNDAPATPNFTVTSFDGTSAATPQVCAVVALMVAAADKAGYRLTVEQIRGILRSSSHVEDGLNQGLPAPILNAEDAVRKVIERAPDPAMRDISKYSIRDFQGVMTNVTPYDEGTEVADLIFGDDPMPIRGGLGPVSIGAYGAQTGTHTWVSPSSNRDYTLVKGEGWPLAGPNSPGPGSPMTPPFETYNVQSAAIAPVVRQVTPPTVLAGQQETIKVDGRYLVPNAASGAVTLGVFDPSISTETPIKVINANPGWTFTHAEFNWDGTLPPRNYRLEIAALGGISKVDSLGNQIALTVQTPAPTSTRKYIAKLFNIDDNGHVSVNINSNVLNVSYGQTGQVDVSQFFNVGAANVIEFTLFNVGGPIAWGFEIHRLDMSGSSVVSDTLIYRNVAGTLGGYGAHNNDTSSGRIFDQWVYLNEDDTFRYYGSNNDPPVCNSYNLGALTGPTLCP